MSVDFLNPWVLILLPLLLPAFFFLGRPRMARLPTWLRRSALGARLVIVASVILALSQPVLGRTSQSQSVVFVVDRSASISAEARERADAFVSQAIELSDETRRAGVVGFAREPVVERPLGATDAETSRPPVIRTDGTKISDGIHLARSMFPNVGAKRIVVLSDGRENLGAAEEEARAAANAGIEISVVPMAAAAPPEVYLEALEVPPQIREGEAVDVIVSVGSTVEADVNLRLWLNSKLISDQRVHVVPGSNRFTATQTDLPKGFQSFWARVESTADSFSENNELAGFTVVKDKPRVLMISQAEADGKELRDALIASNVQVDVRPPNSIPPRLSTMKRYDSLILNNIPSSAFTLDQMKTIQGYVQSLGGGLLVLGGESSFSLGEYAQTPLAEVLPVTMNVPGKRDRGSVALMLVIDRSGSMDMREEGTTKIQMAREAALLSLDSLQQSDYIGIVQFDTQPRWVVQPRQLGNSTQSEQVRESIRRIEATGGTEIYPALDLGYRALRDTPAKYKHIILLTDGRSLSSADYDRLIGQMRADTVTLSTIAVGSDSDTELLEKLARQGEGRYYYVDRARDVPRVTTTEAKIASGSPLVEGAIKPHVISPSPILRTISPAQLPEIGGYVVTTTKEHAQTVLAPDEVRADPILAQWQYGLGRSVAWTSDVKERWSANWLTWPDFKKFWTQAVRWTMPAPSNPNLQVSARLEANNVIVMADAIDDEGAFRDGQDLRVTIVGQQVQVEGAPMRQVAPGRYEFAASVEAQGVYSVDVTQMENGQPVRTESVGFVMPYPAEYRFFGTDEATLGRLAAMTGGKVLQEPAAAFAQDGLTFEGLDWIPLWPWLMGLALVLFPIDIAMRRLQVPTEVVARVFRRWTGLLPFRQVRAD